jgi:hypothetical protein
MCGHLNLEYQNHSRERKDLQDPEPIILSGWVLAALDRGQKTVILKANPLKIFVFVFENRGTKLLGMKTYSFVPRLRLCVLFRWLPWPPFAKKPTQSVQYI